MKSKKRILFSITGGIYLSLVFYISIQFPPLISEKPLASVAARPQNIIAVFLDHMRVAFDAGYGGVQSASAIIIAFLLYRISYKISKCRYARNLPLMALSIIFGCINVAGLCMYWLDCLPMFSSPAWLIGCLLLAFGWAAVFFIVACLVFRLFDTGILFRHDNGNRAYICEGKNWTENHFFLCCFLVILIAWLPWIISYYPASMDNDVFGQLYAWFCEPSNHHPWFSTCVLSNCYRLGASLGSDNLGIFIYIVIRDILLASIYATCIVLQRKAGFHKVFYYGSLAFYAVTPVWGAYAKHAFKDTFSTGLFCFYIVTLLIVIQQIEQNRLGISMCLLHGAAALMVSLFRHNCIFAVLPTTLILAAVLLKKRQPVKYICILMVCMVTYFGYNYYILHFMGVVSGPVTESLSIPLQQTARVVRDHGEELNAEEIAGISGAFQYDKLAEEYDPILSDPIKWNCQVPTEMKQSGANTDWLKTWLKMLFRYPLTYIEAGIGQSYGYYSFTPNLPEKSGNWNSGMTIFDWIGCNSGYDENFDFHYIDRMDNLRQILHAWAKVWDKIPLLCLTDICAFYTWEIVLLFLYLLLNKQFIRMIPFVAVGFMILTCIASPVNNCFRYFAPVAASFPALFLVLENH